MLIPFLESILKIIIKELNCKRFIFFLNNNFYKRKQTKNSFKFF
jgi:hypothetical protein